MPNTEKDIPKIYNASEVEDNIYKAWEESGFFNPDNLEGLSESAEPFTISLPPPNVTGTLHMGHAVMLAIEDAMIRFARMQGKRTLWLPGTDHATIATASKVESIIYKEEGKTRHDLGREEFERRTAEFAQNSHDTIVGQTRKMGASVDWSREAYTFDDERKHAVRTAFKRMFDLGLIYRGHRVVNWDPAGKTTVSDEEVVHKPGKASLYTFRYAKDFPIEIATTRPETKFGDTAVAVHPDDKRYQKFIGKEYKIEYCGNELNIKIIADKEVDAEFGTGAVGVTPAHSLTDADIASRHEINMVQVIDQDAKMTKEAGSSVAGKTTLEAREVAVTWLKDQGLLSNTEEIDQNLSVAERSGGAIEPIPMLQWFIDVNKKFPFTASSRAPLADIKSGDMVTLKGLMQHAVKSGEVEIVPERFSKTYFHWINNLRDWCISRQLWFGHQIPVWYCASETCEPTVSIENPTKCSSCGTSELSQDEDTLDTWFSAGLWTFSTLGWPDNDASDLNTFHPTNVLETGYDILFFWVARMILMSTCLLGEVPFKQVYLHGLVRDANGKKMSKSLGNAINPLDMIAKYGADATRLSLFIGATPGNDSKLSEEKVASFRNFTNKLWNISRFVFMNVGGISASIQATPSENLELSDRWILSRLSEVITSVTAHLENHEFSIAGEELREFTWNEFADWYLEIAKAHPNEEVRNQVLIYTLENILKLWHPFMPFVTEEIYKQFDAGFLMTAKWPQPQSKPDQQAITAFNQIKEITVAIRDIRARYKLGMKETLNVRVAGKADLSTLKGPVEKLTNTSLSPAPDETESKTDAVLAIGNLKIMVDLSDHIDPEVEKARITKELEKAKKYAASIEAKLNNESFTSNAPEEVIKIQRKNQKETEAKIKTLEQELASL